MENDRAFAEILNDCLDAIKAERASVEDCLARYPQHATRLEELLRLSREARSVPLPSPTPEMLAAGERQLLQAARAQAAEEHGAQRDGSQLATPSDRLIEPAKARMRSWPKWVVPAMAVSGSVALLFVCVLVITLGAGATWWAFRDKDVAPNDPSAIQSHSPLPTPTSGTSVARIPVQTPETSATQSHSPLPTPTSGTSVARIPTQTPDQETVHTVFLPFVSDPLPPTSAMLQGIQGLVEIGTDGEPWTLAPGSACAQVRCRVSKSPFTMAAQLVWGRTPRSRWIIWARIQTMGRESSRSPSGLVRPNTTSRRHTAIMRVTRSTHHPAAERPWARSSRCWSRRPFSPALA